MKIKPTEFRQILELAALAEQSGQYPQTNMQQWLSHIRYLWRRNQIIRVLIRGKVYGFLEWIRCRREDLKADELPETPDMSGEVLYFPLAVSKTPGILRIMYRKAILMNPDCRFIAWHKKIDETKDKLFITRTSNQFKLIREA